MGDNKPTSKLGRKGDPRMHRAVAARLSNPDISLFEALRIGGFEYPTNDDASVMDSEKVTLGQRKNQLSRRLRLARKQGGREGQDVDSLSGSNGSRNRESMEGPGSSLSDPQKELQKFMQNSGNPKGNPNSNIGARALQMKREYNALEGPLSDDEVDPDPTVQPEEQPKRQRIAKFHPDYAPLFVPPSASVRNSFGGGNSTPQANAPPPPNVPNQQAANNFGPTPSAVPNMPPFNMGVPGFGTSFGPAPGGFPQNSMFNQQAFNAQQSQQPRASSVAISSLTHSAQAVGMTLEQLAMALASNPTSLAKIMAESNSSDAGSKQEQLALHLYETESKALYSTCMLRAGFDPRQCQPNCQAHLQFALKAWQTEGKRLHDLMGTSRGTGENYDFLNEKNADKMKSNAGNDQKSHDGHGHSHSHGHHSHSHSHVQDGAGGCDAAHLHRLDGQCGHKAIIHQPKDGNAHIDFVVGNNVECYHGIEPSGKNNESFWPSKFKCRDHSEECSNNCARTAQIENVPEPKLLQLSDINLRDPEWNYDVNGSIDGGVMGLFKLGGRNGEITNV